MTLKFIDGFDHYDTAHMSAKWPILGANFGGSQAGITAAQSRHGGQSYFVTAAGVNIARLIGRNFPASSTWVVGFGFRCTALPVSNILMLWFNDGPTSQVMLSFNTNGSLSVTRGGTALTGGATGAIIAPNTWYFVELKFTIANSIAANSCKIRVNGVDAVTLPAGTDLQSTALNTAFSLGLGCNQNLATPVTLYFDDFYVCDQAGSVNNDFLGDCYVETLYPVGSGNWSTWVPSTPPNWSCVSSPIIDDDSTYVSTATLGVRDTYLFGTLAVLPPNIFGVQTCALARKTDVGSRAINLVTRRGGVDYADGPFSLPDAYAYQIAMREADPADGAAWTNADINATEWGIELQS